MTWARLDDGFHSHPKVLEAGNAAAGLYARALSYSGDHLTDGFLPDAWARTAGSRRQIDRLLEVGLWLRADGGYRMRDFLEFNPSREKVLDARKKTAERVATHRAKRNAVTPPVSNSVGNGVSNSAPTRPLREVDKPTSRKDAIWDAVQGVMGQEPKTRSERGAWNRAVKELREAGATPEEIKGKAITYKRRWPDVSLTPTALAKHWGSLNGALEHRCPECNLPFKGERVLEQHRSTVHRLEV